MLLGSSSLRVICAAVFPVVAACGTADLGTYEGVRDLKLDENYYFCVVQPKVITPRRCAAGDTGDPAGGCHASKSSMILVQIDKPVACSADNKPIGVPTPEERSNYSAAQLRATRDVEGSPLLTKPTGKVDHPRTIFDTKSTEADIIRTWIRGAR